MAAILAGFQGESPGTPIPIVTGNQGGNAALTSLISALARLGLVIDQTITSQPEVQILGSLIGTGLADTGIADATNLLVSTQQAFSGLDWMSSNSGNVTISDVGVTAPDSTTTASTMTETSVSGQHWLSQGFYTAASSGSYTFAISFKQGLRTRVTVVIRDSQTSGNNATCTFDLAGGAVGVAAAVNGTWSSPSATITLQSNGFYRCTLTATNTGSGTYDVEVYADNGSGSGAPSTSYLGNASGVALTMWGAGVWAGAAGTYVPLNANGGAIGSTVQQVYVPNGGTTAYWGTHTPGAWIGFDAGVPVVWTRYRFVPRPGYIGSNEVFPYAPDYAQTIAGSLVQTSVSDAAFGTPVLADTIPATNPYTGGIPYYPRYWLSERSLQSAPAARYIRLSPPTGAFGGVSALQVFAQQGTTANACPVQPVISPMGGRFPSLSRSVTITTLTTGAAIYYTTDGSTPTTSSTLYSGPFTLSIGSGAQVVVKAIANLPSLSTPLSFVTTSPPFCGYGYKPNDPWYDDHGNLMESHCGDARLDPVSGSYYWIGRITDVPEAIFALGAKSLNEYQATFLYKGISLDPLDPNGLLNWQNMGDILGQVTGIPRGGRYHWLYNALNNNYVCWSDLVTASLGRPLYYASTSGPNIAGPWAWNLTPISVGGTGIFTDFSFFIDSDGVTAYAVYTDYIAHTIIIQQLNASYTGLTGSQFILTNASEREAPVLFKYPNAPGGTYFLITSQGVPFDSTLNADLRYTYSQGATPVANTWNAVPSSGANCWDFNPTGTNYNGQPTFVVVPSGKVQPMIGMDWWNISPLYNSNFVFLPINVTGLTSMGIGHPATWDPSTLASTFTLATLTLSGNSFTVGAAQGTVIGTVQGQLFPGTTITLTNSNGGAVQLVGGVIQVGPTPPGSAGSFNVQLTETWGGASNSPHVTTIGITENAVNTLDSMWFALPTTSNATLAAAALQYERTQAWTMFAEIQLIATPAAAAIIFTNVLGASPFTGYEVWIDPSGFLRCRILNTAFTNACSIIGSINVCTGVPVFVAVSYDGSSTPAGIKMYVNGVADGGTSVEYNTLSASIVAAGQIWRIGNQLNFVYGLQGYMGFLSMDALARSAGYIGTYSLTSLPPNDASNTKLYLTFANQSGTTITDASASGFNATMSTAAQWAGVLPSPSTIAFDNSVFIRNANVSSIAVTLTTAGANELILLTAVSTNATPPSISDVAGLVWTQLATINTGGSYLWVWTAPAAAKLTGDVITMTGSNLYQIDATAFSGIGPKPLAIPVVTNVGAAQVATPTAPSGLVIAFYSDSNPTPAVGSGWTGIRNNNYTLLEYKTNSSMIASETATNPSGTITGGIVQALN